MIASDVKAIAADYFESRAAIKEKRELDRKHEAQLVRSTIEREKVLAERANTLAIHEHDRALNKIARQKEVDQQMSFLKLSTALNII